jgi:hypothetical protein
MESTSGFEHARNVLETLMERVRRLVEELDGSRQGKRVLKFLDKMAALIKTP